MTKVVKKNRRMQSFDLKKVRKSIEMAAKEARIPPSRRRGIVNDVAKAARDAVKSKAKVSSSYLRTFILRKLDRRAPSVSRSWRAYDRTRK